jgi:hypothetical protein
MPIFTQKIIPLSVSLFALVLITTIPTESNAQKKGGWGAAPLAEKFRPARAWINNFSTTADVIATESIADAIDACDDVVGENRYCVVEVTNTSTGIPLEIYRSKTKLIGVEDMAPLTSTENAIYIYIGDNTKQVIIENLNLQGHAVGNDEIYGIVVEGKNIRKILIRNNKIHHFDSDSDAHGIAVYGTGKNWRQSIRNVIIEDNEVYSMRTGSSESIVINGNVFRWEIKSNDVYDINNIAIDAIGGEGTSPVRKNRRNRILPGRTDKARYGFIENNYVANMNTSDNPAYGREESWAAAIYIDGAHHVEITDNVVENASWAYEVGAENCLVTHHIRMTGNSATGSTYGDILVGGYANIGYATKAGRKFDCNPNTSKDEDEGHGYVRYITFKDNNLQSENTELDRLFLNLRTTHAIIIEAGINPLNTKNNGRARGDENAIITEE